MSTTLYLGEQLAPTTLPPGQTGWLGKLRGESAAVLLIFAGSDLDQLVNELSQASRRSSDIRVIHRMLPSEYEQSGADAELSVAAHGATYVRLVGREIRGRSSWLPSCISDYEDAEVLLNICPDAASRKIMVAGPSHFTLCAQAAVREVKALAAVA